MLQTMRGTGGEQVPPAPLWLHSKSKLPGKHFKCKEPNKLNQIYETKSFQSNLQNEIQQTVSIQPNLEKPNIQKIKVKCNPSLS